MGQHTDRICCYCGETERLEVLELWIEDRAFTIDTCCERSYWLWLYEMEHWDRAEWKAFLAEEAGIAVRSVGGPSSSSGRTLDYGLEFDEIRLADAKDFILEHHRHNRPPVSWRWGHAVRNGAELVGVAMVGRPVARRIDHTKVVEVNRVCTAHEVSEVTWNACSMLYAAAAKEAKRRGFEKIITYTLEEETGSALKAVGWTPVAKTKGGSWNRPSRARTDTAPTCRKVRWEKELR